MSLKSKLTNSSSSLKFSFFMFCTKPFESLIKLFTDVVICRNFPFDKSLPVLDTAELIPSLILKRYLCIFNYGFAEGV